jgi:hypothetical protein
LRAFAEGNYVILHTRQERPGDSDWAGIDIFRLNDEGKILEHWDVLQRVPAESPTPTPCSDASRAVLCFGFRFIATERGGSFPRCAPPALFSGDVLVVVQILCGYIIFEDFTSCDLRHIGRGGIFDALNRLSFESISFFPQLDARLRRSKPGETSADIYATFNISLPWVLPLALSSCASLAWLSLMVCASLGFTAPFATMSAS